MGIGGRKTDYYMASFIYVTFQKELLAGGRLLLRFGVYIVTYGVFAATATRDRA